MPGLAHHRAQAVKLCRVCASIMQGHLGFTAPQSSQTVLQLCYGPDWDMDQQSTAREPDLTRALWKEMSFYAAQDFLHYSSFSYYSGSFNPFSKWQNTLIVLLICTEGQLRAPEPVEYILCQGQSASISQDVCVAPFT